MDKLNELVIDNLGISFIIVSLVAWALLHGAWWARGVRERMRKIDAAPCKEHGEALQRAEKQIVQIADRPCKEHGDALQRTEKQIAQITDRPCDIHRQKLDDHARIITRLDTTIELLKSLLYTPKSGPETQPFTQSQSPLSITDAGRAMMERTGLSAMFEEQWPAMSAFITEKARSLNPYDIQEMLIEQCVVHPDKFLTTEQIDLLKLDAYNTGNVLASYMKVVAVLARDRYFDEHDINTAEVDAYGPKGE